LLELFSNILDDTYDDAPLPANELDCYLRDHVLDYKKRKMLIGGQRRRQDIQLVGRWPNNIYITAITMSVPSERSFT